MLHLRNSTSGLPPAADNLQQGQLAINTADATLWTLSSSSVVKKIGDASILAAVAFLAHSPRTVTTSSSTLSVSTDYYVGVNYAGAVALALPAGSTATTNQKFIVKDESGLAANNNITITANGTDKIDGQSSLVIAINNGSITLFWTGSRWSIV
jgi:hypothetical protein